MALAGAIRFAGGQQPVAGVQADRVQQAIANALPFGLTLHEGLIDQLRQQIQR